MGLSPLNAEACADSVRVDGPALLLSEYYDCGMNKGIGAADAQFSFQIQGVRQLTFR